MVLVSRFGALGAAVATSLSGWMTLLFGTAAVKLAGAGQTIWGGKSTEAAIKQAGASWWSFSKLAYPSAAMRILESCGFSGVVTTSSLLPTPKIEVDIMSLSLNVYGCLFTPFPALSICADTRVGNAIGRGDAAEAKRAMRVAALLSIPAAAAISLAPGQTQTAITTRVNVDFCGPFEEWTDLFRSPLKGALIGIHGIWDLSIFLRRGRKGQG